MASKAERLAELQARKVLYLAAETAVLQGHQSYSGGGLSVIRGDLKIILEEIRKIDAAIANLSGMGILKATFTRD